MFIDNPVREREQIHRALKLQLVTYWKLHFDNTPQTYIYKNGSDLCL